MMLRQPLIRRASMLLALVACSGIALAQEQAEQELDLRATEFIFVEGSLPLVPTANTIASKLPLPLHMTPNNVGLVTEALFDEQYGRVLGDALHNVSGINVQPGFGITDYFVVRGFDSLSSGLVLTDGAPEPEATFYQLYNVELVEVLKGPGGFLYGSNPLAATVNLVRKQPVRNRDVSVGAAIGSFSTLEGRVDYNHHRGDQPWAFRFNGLVRDDSGYRDNRDSTAIGINPTVSYFTDTTQLNVGFEYARADFSPEAGVPLVFGAIPDIRLENDYNAANDRSEQNVYRFQVDYESQITDGFRLRNKLYYRGLDWLSDGTLLLGAAPTIEGGVAVFRTQISLDDSQSYLGNQLEGVFTFDAGDTSHNLLGGLEVARFADAFTLDVGFLAPVDLIAPVDPGFPAQPIPGQAVAGDARSIVVAPYLVDQIGIGNRVQILAGVRLDRIDFEDTLSGRSRDDTEWSPMVGAAFAAADDVTLYGNYSRSFAPPSPRTFGQSLPEESSQIEAGMKLRFLNGRAQATAAVYRLERDNIAIPDDNGFTQQIGNQRSTGFELELVAEPGDGVRGVVSYAYNDAELTEFTERVQGIGPFGPFAITLDHAGNRPAFAPEHLLNVWLSKTFTNGLGISVGGRYIGEQFIAEDNGFAIDDALVLGGAVSWAWRGYRLSLSVENLTDHAYFVRGFGSQSVTPAAPLAAFLRIGHDF